MYVSPLFGWTGSEEGKGTCMYVLKDGGKMESGVDVRSKV